MGEGRGKEASGTRQANTVARVVVDEQAESGHHRIQREAHGQYTGILREGWGGFAREEGTEIPLMFSQFFTTTFFFHPTPLFQRQHSAQYNLNPISLNQTPPLTQPKPPGHLPPPRPIQHPNHAPPTNRNRTRVKRPKYLETRLQRRGRIGRRHGRRPGRRPGRRQGRGAEDDSEEEFRGDER